MDEEVEAGRPAGVVHHGDKGEETKALYGLVLDP